MHYACALHIALVYAVARCVSDCHEHVCLSVCLAVFIVVQNLVGINAVVLYASFHILRVWLENTLAPVD